MNAVKVDGYFLLAERAPKTADILFRADQMEAAALNVQQMVVASHNKQVSSVIHFHRSYV